MQERECRQCGRRFWSWREQEGHLCEEFNSKKLRGDIPKFEFTCNECGKKSLNKYWMEIHIARNHDDKLSRQEVQKEMKMKRNW